MPEQPRDVFTELLRDHPSVMRLVRRVSLARILPSSLILPPLVSVAGAAKAVKFLRTQWFGYHLYLPAVFLADL